MKCLCLHMPLQIHIHATQNDRCLLLRQCIFMEIKSARLLRPGGVFIHKPNSESSCPASSFFYFLFLLFGAGGEGGTRNRSGQGTIDSWEASLVLLFSCPFLLSSPAVRHAYPCVSWGRQLLTIFMSEEPTGEITEHPDGSFQLFHSSLFQV